MTNEGTHRGSIGSAMTWMLGLSILLFWMPLLGGLIAGFVGGRKAGKVSEAVLAVILPGLILGILTFLLGSKERYAEEFDSRPGTYYFSSGWLEYPDRKGDKPELMPSSGLGEGYAKYRNYEKLVEQYGEDNARYLSEFMNQWEQHYTHGALVDFSFLKHLDLDRRVTEICMEKGWEFLRLQGGLDLLQDWLDGRWDDEQFLRVPPGHVVKADYLGGIVKAVTAEEFRETEDE